VKRGFSAPKRCVRTADLSPSQPIRRLRAGTRCIVLEQHRDGEDHGDAVSAVFLKWHSWIRGNLLIGCDGLRSAVRTHLFGAEKPRFTGQVTWRCLLPTEIAAPFMSAGRSAIFIGPGRFFNRYTVRRKTLVNCVATAKTGIWSEEGWSVPSTVAEFIQQYDGWHPDVIGPDERAPPDQLFNGRFSSATRCRLDPGRITLLGDAAHPMLPFLGLGAALAIEDAVVLSMALSGRNAEPDGLMRYERARIGRTTHIFGEARRQGEIYQGDDPTPICGRTRRPPIAPCSITSQTPPLPEIIPRRVRCQNPHHPWSPL